MYIMKAEAGDKVFDAIRTVIAGKVYPSAARLELSPKTVDAHKKHIKQKLCCSSFRELRRLAVDMDKQVMSVHSLRKCCFQGSLGPGSGSIQGTR